jgi:hypothetical protein
VKVFHGVRPSQRPSPNRFGRAWQIVPGCPRQSRERVRACAGTMGDGGALEAALLNMNKLDFGPLESAYDD